MSTPELRAAIIQASNWQSAAQAAQAAQASAERQRDAALAELASLRAELQRARQHVTGAADLLALQMDAEAAQASRATAAQEQAERASRAEYSAGQHRQAEQALATATAELASLRQRIERIGDDTAASIAAGAAAMRATAAALVMTYPNKKAATEIATHIQALPIPTPEDIQNG